jgi:hypothetical protein
MVQHSFPRSLGKKFPHQPINSKKITYRTSPFLFAKIKKRRVNSAAKEDVADYPVCYEPSAEVSV